MSQGPSNPVSRGRVTSEPPVDLQDGQTLPLLMTNTGDLRVSVNDAEVDFFHESPFGGSVTFFKRS